MRHPSPKKWAAICKRLDDYQRVNRSPHTSQSPPKPAPPLRLKIQDAYNLDRYINTL